mgnify:CR=1 FL=1
MSILTTLRKADKVGAILIIIILSLVGYAVYDIAHTKTVKHAILMDILTSTYEDKPLSDMDIGYIGGRDILAVCSGVEDYIEQHPERKEALMVKSVVVRNCLK